MTGGKFLLSMLSFSLRNVKSGPYNTTVSIDTESALTADGESTTTRERLFHAAVGLFSQKWYSEVSVADICRTANLSNGIYYRYFRDKETIFREIVERYLEHLSARLSAIAEHTGLAGVRAFAETILAVHRDYPDLVSIFREGQYRFYEYERRISRLFADSLERIFGRTLSASESIFLLSGTRFLAFRAMFNEVPVVIDSVVDIIRGGVFTTQVESLAPVFDLEIQLPPVRLEKTVHQRQLEAGKRLFGRLGYHEVNIHEITRETGVAVGTFYNYFESKEAFYADVIHLVSHEIRSFISRNLDTSLPRLEQELQGMLLFSFYITSVDPSCYNIVREGEFVVPSRVREYYDEFERGYHKRIADMRPLDHRTTSNFLMGLSHFLGLEILYDGTIDRAKSLITELGQHLSNGIDYPEGMEE